MKNRPQIGRKLARVFLLQAVFIGVAAFLGVVAAKYVLESLLIQQALRDEAEHFWDRLRDDPSFPAPDTRNMKGYFAKGDTGDSVPLDIRSLQDGFHDLSREDSFVIAYVSRQGGSRLFLIFDGQRVEELALFFGMVPLAASLFGIYLAALAGYYLSRRAVSPILRLARQVGDIDPGVPEKSLLSLESLPAEEDQEVSALSEALARMARRIRQFVERERTFTRDVSHELRTPITVIRIAADLLMDEGDLPASAHNCVVRVKRAVKDMEELTEAFLLLSRESEQGLPLQPVCLNTLAEEELDQARLLLEGKSVITSLESKGRLIVMASERVLSILLGNLIRNACTYTDSGYVRVCIGDRRLSVEDSGPGMSEEEVSRIFHPFFRGTPRGQGYGVGLTIVKRLSDRFGWPLQITSQAGAGTRVIVEFPDAMYMGRLLE